MILPCQNPKTSNAQICYASLRFPRISLLLKIRINHDAHIFVLFLFLRFSFFSLFPDLPTLLFLLFSHMPGYLYCNPKIKQRISSFLKNDWRI